MSKASEGPDSRLAASASFPTTRWSLVLRVGESGAQESGVALEQLLSSYWYPLYAFVRRKGQDPEQAFDLTQEFFARLLTHNYLAIADPGRGRFRTFLLTAMNRFLINDWNAGQRLKRGGGRRFVPLEPREAESRYALEPADNRSPERLYERRWALAILEQAMAQLDAEHRGTSREAFFREARPLLSGDGDGAPVAEIAARLGMTAGAVKTALFRLRQRYGELLRAEIAETVASAADVEDEIQHLFAALA